MTIWVQYVLPDADPVTLKIAETPERDGIAVLEHAMRLLGHQSPTVDPTFDRLMHQRWLDEQAAKAR